MEDNEETIVWDMSGKAEKKVSGMWISKKEFADKPLIGKIVKGFTNKGKPCLNLMVENEPRNLEINNKIYNELTEYLGEELSNWVDKEIKLETTEWEGVVEGKETTGYSWVLIT